MNWLVIGGIVLVLLLVQGVIIYFLTRRSKGPEADQGGFMLLQQQLQDIRQTLDNRVNESSKRMDENMRAQHESSSRLIKEITEEITSVKEIGRQTGEYAKQLQGLQDILKNPKQRGVLGEYYLETVLKNVLPPGMYKTQYHLGRDEDGKELIPDAVVFINDKILAIDSKFSLENYNRLVACAPEEKAALEKLFVNDLKMRIQETAKYIRPEDGTMDFAFMFIPSEGIYYDLLVNTIGAGEEENLLQRASSKHKVIIVSPTSFLAYLQTVMQGLKALEIEQKAVEIQKRVGELGKHIGAYDTFYKKLGTALGTAVSHYNSGSKELGKIDKDVYRIEGSKIGIETILLEKPSEELDEK